MGQIGFDVNGYGGSKFLQQIDNNSFCGLNETVADEYTPLVNEKISSIHIRGSGSTTAGAAPIQIYNVTTPGSRFPVGAIENFTNMGTSLADLSQVPSVDILLTAGETYSIAFLSSTVSPNSQIEYGGTPAGGVIGETAGPSSVAPNPYVSNTTSNRRHGMYALTEAVATSPTITSIGGDDDIFDGETSVATVGTSFLAFAAGSKLELTNDAGTVIVDQLLTGSDWADTLITIPTIIRGGLKYTNDHKVKVTDSAAGTGELVFTLSPPSGYNDVDVVSPISDNTSVFFGASPAVATGDQAKVPALTDQGGSLLLDPSGTFTITGGGNTHTFELEVWDATDSTWSNTVVQTVNGSVSTQMVKSMVSNMVSEMVK